MTISEVSKQYNISMDTLRYYEKMGLIPAVSRTKGGIRNYTQEDCNWVEFIKCMRSASLSIEVLGEYVSLFKDGDITTEKRKNILIAERQKLLAKRDEIDNTISRLDYKIEKYDSVMAVKENELVAKS